MTTLRKLISQIDFSNKKLKSDPDWKKLSSTFSIFDLNWSDDERLTSYFIKVHYCTDSRVGLKAYFLDGEFVAISNRFGKKCNEEFEFVSKEAADNVHKYLLSLIEPDEYNVDIITDLCLDEEMSDTYKIKYNTQILHEKALYEGESVDIIKTNFVYEGIHSPNYFHSVEIKTSNNEKLLVNCADLDFEYNTL